MKWDHSEDYFVPTFMTGSSGGGKQIKVNLQDEKFKYIEGHVIDGKILIPATAYLKFVWEALIDQNDCDPEDPVEFSDVRFVRATNMNADTIVDLKVNIQVGTGIFEVGFFKLFISFFYFLLNIGVGECVVREKTFL